MYERRLDRLEETVESMYGDRKVTFAFVAYEYADDGECIAVTLNGKHRTERKPDETKDALLNRAQASAGLAEAITVGWLDASDAKAA